MGGWVQTVALTLPVLVALRGCGVFGGDVHLKAMLQWLAASMAERSMDYYEFGDDRCVGLQRVTEAFRSRNATVRELWLCLCAFEEKTKVQERRDSELFPYLLSLLESNDDIESAVAKSLEEAAKGQAEKKDVLGSVQTTLNFGAMGDDDDSDDTTPEPTSPQQAEAETAADGAADAGTGPEYDEPMPDA